MTDTGPLSQGLRVQPCMLVFWCPKCGYRVEENAWDGPVSCEIKGDGPRAHAKTWMIPISIKHPFGFIHPDSLAHPDNVGKGRGGSQTSDS